jgi:flagellar protein FlaG
MIPQSVALRDAVKPDVNQADQTRAVFRQNIDRAEMAQKAKQREDKESPMSLEKAVEKSNDTARQMNSQIRFQVDDKTGQVIVKIINKDTKEVIRQIPSEEMVKLASRAEDLRGLIFNVDG